VEAARLVGVATAGGVLPAATGAEVAAAVMEAGPEGGDEHGLGVERNPNS
jgi:hypothetical protein